MRLSARGVTFSFCVLWAAAFLPDACQAGSQFSIATPKFPVFELESEQDIGVKLAPELRPTAMLDATFVGVTKSGDPVVRFADGVSIAEAKDSLNELHLEFSQLSSNTDVVVTSRIVVFLTSSDLVERLELPWLKIVKRYPPGNFLIVESSEEGFTGADLTRLSSNRAVRYVEPSFPRFLDEEAPNDPTYASGRLWGLTAVSADQLWRGGATTDVLVSVIDTGLDLTHPDLNVSSQPNGLNLVSKGSPAQDDHGHGTHVAGIIGARGNNGEGVVGVGWGVSLLPIKIFPKSGGRPDPAFDEDVVEAIDYSVKVGAKVINASWSGPNFSFAVKEAINRAATAGVIVVAAASNNYGNNNDINPWYPAAYRNSNLISVMSVDEDGSRSDFSNFGSASVTIAAPGSAILSTDIGGSYRIRQGTSQAAPFVSGAVAVLWGRRGLRDKSALEIKDLIVSSARILSTLAGQCMAGGMLSLSLFGQPFSPSIFSAEQTEQNAGRLDVSAGASTLKSNLEPLLESLRGEPVILYAH